MPNKKVRAEEEDKKLSKAAVAVFLGSQRGAPGAREDPMSQHANWSGRAHLAQIVRYSAECELVVRDAMDCIRRFGKM